MLNLEGSPCSLGNWFRNEVLVPRDTVIEAWQGEMDTDNWGQGPGVSFGGLSGSTGSDQNVSVTVNYHGWRLAPQRGTGSSAGSCWREMGDAVALPMTDGRFGRSMQDIQFATDITSENNQRGGRGVRL